MSNNLFSGPLNLTSIPGNLQSFDLSTNTIYGNIRNTIKLLTNKAFKLDFRNDLFSCRTFLMPRWYGKVDMICATSTLNCCRLGSNIGFWTSGSCARCDMTNVRITITVNTISYYKGLPTSFLPTQITGTDSWSSNPIIFDFTSIPSSFGTFNLPSNAINM